MHAIHRALCGDDGWEKKVSVGSEFLALCNPWRLVLFLHLCSQRHTASSIASFELIVVEQLLNQVDVAQQHTTATVTLQTESIQRITVMMAKKRKDDK